MTPVRASAQWHWRPQTRLGALALQAVGAAGTAMLVLFALTAAGQRGPGFNLWLAIPLGVAGLSALLGGVLAVIAVVRHHERAVTIIVPIGLAALVLMFALGEALVPH